ncbi:endonuclease/exonuclease/phosphatase [Mucidula mucida]|nr:endonuclease/exonuclease/phosphatase [Mucidula mucida]
MLVERLSILCLLTVLAPSVTPALITDIQGISYRSSYVGQTLDGITGVVTAKGSSGFYLLGEPSDDIRASNGIYVFSSSAVHDVEVGDNISFTGKVAEYRPSSAPNYLYLTEITSHSNITVLSSVDRSPPTQYMSALDVGSDGWLSVPNNVSRVTATDSPLQPDLYGMDFWESLDGQLVTIPTPIALNFENSFGEFWVRGNWEVTGLNERGGLTVTIGEDNIPDANPEVVIIGDPLDGTTNPTVAVGVQLSDITGVVTYSFGFYYVLPLTAPTVLSAPDYDVSPTTVTSVPGDSCVVTFGDYNVENMAPTSDHIPAIQDNSGPTDDGTVDANITLSTLVAAIANVSDLTYDFIEVAPQDGQDGGQPGGNIRVAYLYNSAKLSLVSGASVGRATDKVNVTIDASGLPTLNYNPGRIDPANSVWESTRKPLVAEWQLASGAKLFTVDVHMSSKGGSSSTQGDARPPVNSPVQTRTGQVEVLSSFVQTILDVDPDANVLVAGDFNEYAQTRSVFASITELLQETDEIAGIAPVERYTYVFDQNTQQLDHIFISDALALRGVEVEHIHVNNWSPSYDERISDHDPTVGKVRLC